MVAALCFCTASTGFGPMWFFGLEGTAGGSGIVADLGPTHGWSSGLVAASKFVGVGRRARICQLPLANLLWPPSEPPWR